MTQEFHFREVSRLLGISEGRLRRWARLGLITSLRRPQQGLAFDFQGLVALRTVKRLRSQGVSLKRLKRCVATLKKLHPELTQPLAQVRILGGRRLILAQKSQQFTPEGQLVLDFEAEAPETLSLPEEQLSRLFLAALEKEHHGEWDGAKRVYNLILALKPNHPDALVNLGNILYRLGFPEGAAAHYAKALESEPQHLEATFNLASVLEEQGHLPEAVSLYRQALNGEPHFSEACFNLARVLERLGDLAGAREYWRRYLELEPCGDWADYVRKRLTAPQKGLPPKPPQPEPEQ